MAYKYGDVVRITEGFYKGQRGMVIGKDEVHIDGTIGHESKWSYQVILVLGRKIVEIEEQDLRPEIEQIKIETGEDIENQIEEEIENPEENIENNKEENERNRTTK